MKFFPLFLLGAVLASADTMHHGFTGTYFFGNKFGEVKMDELDVTPIVIPLGAVEYPADLIGSGYIGSVGVMASVKEDGGVNWVLVSDGNDRRFAEPVRLALKDWRFSIPRKNARPVPAFIKLRIFISEHDQPRIVIEPREESPRPTRAVGPHD
jgi:hypothetical protein